MRDGVRTLNIEKVFDINNFAYTRTFNSTNWQALYVPFQMSYEDWATSDVEIAYLNAIHQYDDDNDGAIDRTELEAFIVKGGTLKANHPYFIKAKSTGTKTINLSNVRLLPTTSESIDCSSTTFKYTFCGTYDVISGSDMMANGFYAMGNKGNLSQAASASSDLKAMRWYLNVESRGSQLADAPMHYAGAIRLNVIDDMWEEEATDIQVIEHLDRQYLNESVFDLQGRRVQNIQKGDLYVKGGKKVVFK